MNVFTWELLNSNFGVFIFVYFIYTIIVQFFRSKSYDDYIENVGLSLLLGFVSGIVYSLVVTLLQTSQGV